MILRLLSVFVSAILTAATASSEIETRVLNDGNLILEGIPEIDSEIVESLNRYQNVRSAPFAEWTVDGKGIFITTRFGDVSQIHLVDHAGGARKQLTFFHEPVSSISRSPISDDLIFLMDVGGSENDQIQLMNPRSGTTKVLTDGKSRNQAVCWSPDGSSIAYQSNRRDGASNDIWWMPIDDPQAAKMIWEATDNTWWGAAAWSEDGKYLLIQQYLSASDSRIFLLDINSGNSRMLEGSEEKPSSNSALDFSRDGSGYFFTSNRFSGQLQLAYRDLKTQEVTVITKSIPWDLEAFALAKDGSRAAFTTNEDGVSRLYLLDPSSFQCLAVGGLPVGVIGNIEFSPSADKLALSLNTAQTPTDSFVMQLGEGALDYGALTRWTFSEVGGLNTDEFVLPKLIRYESFDGLMIPAFVYVPKGKGPFPVVIQIHGGPESQSRPGFSSTYQQWIDQLGAAVVVPNVRGSTGYGVHYQELDNGYRREDSIRDIGALLDWIGTQSEFDAKRVAVYGGSYGGYMSLASATHFSDRLRAAVDVVGISNFVTFLENTQSYRRDLRRAEYGDERDPEMRRFLEIISPNNHVDKIHIPLLVVQGQNDPRVPVSEAEQIVESLRESGKPVWYMNALNEGHGYQKKENRDVYQQAVLLFLRTYL